MSNEIIIEDGIINPNVYWEQDIRLLWVLKEANDTKSKEGWDSREFLKNREGKEGLFNYTKWRATFGLICKISHGILDNKLTYKQVNSFNREELTHVLDKIACINVKKTPGGGSVNYNDFNAYISDPDYLVGLKKQIEHKIKPKIVICGNTFQYLFPAGTIVFDYNKEWLYQREGIKYINGWHPNARINHEQYFNDIRRELN